MAKENKTRDDINSNDTLNGDNHTGTTTGHENPEHRNASDTPKENPFSFKHFLRRDPSTSSSSSQNPVNGNDSGSSTQISHASSSSLHSNTGARPKVFYQNDVKMKRSPKFSSFDSQSSLSELAEERNNMHSSRSNNSFNIDYQFPSSRSYSNYDTIENTPERKHTPQHTARRSTNNVNNSSNLILPDFVQDHFLDYYNSDSPSANMSPLSCDDFSLSGNGNGIDSHNGGSKNGNNRSPNCRRRVNPMDLPTSNRPNDLGEISVQREESYGPHNEPEMQRDQAAVDKMQTLPDFLSDGPHSSGRIADVAAVNVDEDNQSIIMRLQQENERLRNELDNSRRVIVDLENQISHAKNLETQYNVTLAESMEQVEENLLVTNQKAAEAQAQANKYKLQVKQMMSEMQQLRKENEMLREGGAIGGISETSHNNPNSRHLARDLRLAAASAENNLRQLLTGVENLRLIARSIESTEEASGGSASQDFLSDCDENDFNEGPAL